MHARAEDDAFALHLAHAQVDVFLLHLEVWDAVAEQAADAVRPLEHDDGMAGASELLRDGKASGARTDDSD
jgi:hypothetical protein